MTTIQGPAHLLFRNNLGQANHSLRVALADTQSGRDAFGAIVRVKTSAGILTKIKAGGAGFQSQYDGLSIDTEGIGVVKEFLRHRQITYPIITVDENGITQIFVGDEAAVPLSVICLA